MSDVENDSNGVQDEEEETGFERNLYNLDDYELDSTVNIFIDEFVFDIVFFQQLDLIQLRVDVIPDLSRFTELTALSFRQNLLIDINEHLLPLNLLTELDLNDNQINEIKNLETLVNLTVMDLSYNRIRKLEGLQHF